MPVDKDLQRVRHRLLASALVFPALYIFSILFSVAQDYRTTLNRAEQDATRISTALREHANRAIGEADRVMLNAITDLTDNGTLVLQDENTLHRLLKTYSNTLPQLRGINAVNAEGDIIGSGTSFPAHHASVRDRDYFRYHSTKGNSGLYLSRAFESRTSGQWIFTISRSIRGPDGSLKLILVAGMSAAYFENFYRSLDLGDHSRLLLVRDDGWVMVQSPLDGDHVDTNLDRSPLFEHVGKAKMGSYQVRTSLQDDAPRVVGYTTSANYPFVAVASLSEQEVLAEWDVRMRQSLAWGMVAAMLMLLLIALLRRQFGQLMLVQGDIEYKNKTLARSERRYHELVNGIDGIVWEAEYPSLRFTYVSKNAGKISGHEAAEWLSNPDFWEGPLATDRRRLLRLLPLGQCNPSTGVVSTEHRIVSPTGNVIWLLNRLTVTENDGVITLRGIIVDNTDRKREYEELELAAEVFENSLLGILIASRDGTILRVNSAFSSLLGYTAEELVGSKTSAIDSDMNDPAVAMTVRTSLRTTGKWQGEIHTWTKHGDQLVLMNDMSLVYGDRGRPKGVIVICKDITTQKVSEHQLYQMAHFDHLTQLPNRRTFSDRIQHAITIAERQQSELALMFLDLDHFKTINDTLGHSVGDRVLSTVASRISTCLRSSDTVARVGGDEFVVLLEDAYAASGTIEQIAQKLCHSVSESIQVNGVDLFVGLSIGISLFPQDGTDSETLLRNADTAMYRAKLAGRSCWRFFNESMARDAARRLDLRMALRHAIERDEMVLHYQPQRSLHTGAIIGVEALIRWQRPGVGTVSPLEFIPISEESNLIVPLGYWVLRTACTQSVAWIRDKNLRLRMGVNVTAKQIHEDGFVEQVRAILQSTGLPPELLELEITESSILDNIDEAASRLSQLKKLGVSVAIDDFGTGYSSLSYLSQLPIDRLKIDQSFVRDTPADLHDCAIVRTIIAMSDNLGLSVIAEGVESDAQSQFLVAEGCDEIQGYLLSAPMPADALAEML